MLSRKQDAYGAEILAYLEGKHSFELVEREDGYVDVSLGSPLYFAPYKAWPVYEKQALKFARGKVLDVGCGAGRVMHYLEQKGHEVLGIDNSPGAIKVCHKLGMKHTRLMSITQISRRLGLFDTITMFGNNFGLFGSFKRAKWLLKRMHGMTSNDARIIANSTDPHKTNMSEHLEYQKWNLRRGRMAGQVRIRIRFLKQCSPYFDYLLVSPGEMKTIVAGTGWKINRIIASDGPSYMAIIDKT